MKIPNKKEQEALLACVAERRGILETAIRSVCQGFTPAAFIWGAPGLGKSHHVHGILNGLVGRDWKHHTAYATPKALMLTLAEEPGALHLFEDCETLLKTDLSSSLLRAACGSPEGRERWVTYETANERLKVNVTGGIIIITNENLARTNGPMQGVASRFRPLQWSMTLKEVVASILAIAENGWEKQGMKVTATECRMVATELIACLEESEADLALDIRLYVEHALPTYLFCKHTRNKGWKQVLASKLSGLATSETEAQTKRTQRLKGVAQLISAGPGTPADKLEKWKTLTGLSKSIWYRYASVKIQKLDMEPHIPE